MYYLKDNCSPDTFVITHCNNKTKTKFSNLYKIVIFNYLLPDNVKKNPRTEGIHSQDNLRIHPQIYIMGETEIRLCWSNKTNPNQKVIT